MTEIANDCVYALASDGQSLFAARQSGLYRAAGAGQPWTPLYAGLHLAEPLPTTAAAAVRCGADLHLFAGVPGGIMRSHDGGAHWQVTTLPAAPPISAIMASPCYASDGTVFAATLGDGVLLSVDHGQHWAHWSFGLIDLAVLCLAVSPDFARDRTVYAGTETGLFRSSTGGRSWREVALPCDAPVTSIACSPATENNPALLVGTDGQGLWRTENHTTWHMYPHVPGDAPVLQAQMVQSSLVVVTDACALIAGAAGESWAVLAAATDGDIITAAAISAESVAPTVALGYDDGHVSWHACGS